MSLPTALAIALPLVVAFMAALTAFAIWRLTGQSNYCNHQHYVGGCTQSLCFQCSGHTVQQSPDDHKDCAGANYGHEEFASRDHTHLQQPCQCQGDLERLQGDLNRLREEMEGQRTQYVLRDELNQIKNELAQLRHWVTERLNAISSVSVDAVQRMLEGVRRVLRGILYGGVIGGIAGLALAFVLFFVLPFVYEQRLIGVDGELLATTTNRWPMAGIVLGGMIIGAIIGGIINMIRNNRQTIEEIQ